MQKQRDSDLAGPGLQDDWSSLERRQLAKTGATSTTSLDRQRITSGRLSDAAFMDESANRAIEDFMRSPRSLAQRKTNNQAPVISSTGSQKSLKHSSRLSNKQGVPGAQVYKKTGVQVSKSYQMLCGNCGKRFAKIMILELTNAPAELDQSVFDIQAYFNSTQNYDYECPFCYFKAQIILSESLLVGDAH